MSTQALFSPHWYRVKDVTPWLASDVVAHRHVYRGKVSYVLHRRSTGTHYRMDAATYELVGLLDGALSVDELWQHTLEKLDSEAPNQDEMLILLAALHEAELLVVNKRLDSELLFSRRSDAARISKRQRLLNPLYMRISLHDPDRWLSVVKPLATGMFSRTALLIWGALLLITLLLLVPASSILLEEVRGFDFFSSQHILIFFIVYPLLKLLHELAHALAVKRAGGEVHEMGIALMVLLPIPFVDASSSAVFANKRDRMLVDVAGMLVEVGVAAIAALVWLNTVGPVHEIALMLMLIGGISTVLFNGNPLLKFDGYYLLADWLEIPNLAQRARRRVGDVLRMLLFSQSLPSSTADRRENMWLLIYGVMSGIYRVLLMLSIAWMLSGRFFMFGLLLALYVVTTAMLQPTIQVVAALLRDATLSAARLGVVLLGLPLLFLVPVVTLPLPFATSTTGVVWLPDEAVVRATSSCEVTAVLQQPGNAVTAGTPLFVCEDPALDTQLLTLQARADSLSAESAGLIGEDPVQHARLARERATIVKRMAVTRERIRELEIVAAVDGRFDVTGVTSLLGRFLETGEIAAYVVPDSVRTVRVALDETGITWLQKLERVDLRIAAEYGKAEFHTTSVVRQTPEASLMVPSAALSTAGGGVLPADTAGDGRRLLAPAFDLELGWPSTARHAPIGSHVDVRFVHAPIPLAARWVVHIQRALLGRLDA
ncbi:MAG: M50 family metallopeptidase [Granulosicoccus sp.]